MRFVRIRLDSADGRRLSPRRAVRRLAGLAVSVLALGIGLLGIVFNDPRRGWQDRWARTDVIYADTGPAPAPWAAGRESDVTA